jgi:ketosteroid isomerase-like protein
MGSENVELVKSAYEAFNAGGSKAILPFLADDVEWDESQLPARQPGVYHGHEGMLELDRQNAGLWREIRAELEEVVDAGPNRVVALLRAVGHGRFTGEEVVLPIAHLWQLRGGKAVRVKLFLDRQQALEETDASD